MESYNILLLDQGRQSLPFLKSLNQAGHKTKVVCNTLLCESYFSRYADERLIWPSYVNDRAGFEKCLFQYLKTNKVDITIAVGDITADILSKNKDVIQQHTNICSPDYSILYKGAEKLELMRFCMENNLPCPKTFEFNEDAINKIDELLQFPVIVKPTRMVGAIGVTRFNSTEELREGSSKLLNEFDDLLIQEYIPLEGVNQFMAEAFVDDDGEMKVCVVIEKTRIFPVKAGTSSANRTVTHAAIENVTRRLLESIHWRGAADIDYIVDPRDNQPKILEINPRITAGIKNAFLAGVDFADLHVKLATGQPIPKIEAYKTNVYCRNLFLDMLWHTYASSDLKKSTSPSFFAFFKSGYYDQVFSWDDPLTGLGFFLNMLKKYLNVKKFKSKFLTRN